jgi:ribosomal protein L11 methyltransferase
VSRQQLTLRVSAADVPTAEALLELAGAETISLHDAADDPVLEPEPSTAPLWPNVTLKALFADDADLAPLHALLAATCAAESLAVTTLEDSAWQPGLHQTVKARPIGRRIWLTPADQDLVPPSRIPVRIRMGLAFGTGEHPTTALCLEWIERHADSGMTFLDYGCGSGILAITALALGATHAYAVDNDSQALLATRANAALNGVGDRLFVGLPEALPPVTVDVLAANILAAPLVELAATFAAHVRPGGSLVLSGILEGQAARVIDAHEPYFRDFEPAVQQGWVCLVATRNAGEPNQEPLESPR